jgi:hypothetical protein
VAALDWATWHLYNQPKHDICQLPIGPRAESYCHINLPHHSPCFPVSLATSITVLPSHLTRKLLTSSRATCHPFSGDMCHLGIGPTVRSYAQICLTRVTSWCCHMSPSGFTTCRLYGPATSTYGHATSVPVQTVRTAQSANFFLLV